MAHITLAECNGAAWLVDGEALIDDFLANTLEPDVTIEIIACDSKSAVLALWAQHGGQCDGADPWMIHPAILARARGHGGAHAVIFPAWSALLDEAAREVIATASRHALQDAALAVVLVEFLQPGGAEDLEDLSRLRLNLIRRRLEQAGVAPDRIGHAQGDWTSLGLAAEDSQRVDIVVRTVLAPSGA
jgi:hypothetical protein